MQLILDTWRLIDRCSVLNHYFALYNKIVQNSQLPILNDNNQLRQVFVIIFPNVTFLNHFFLSLYNVQFNLYLRQQSQPNYQIYSMEPIFLKDLIEGSLFSLE